MPERLLLVGMMGAGKSTVGRLLARQLGWSFRDVDAEVERAAGATVAEVFSGRGEAGFRELEAEQLEAALLGEDAAVVSVGGGAVLSEANRARLSAGGTVVWLRAGAETLAARVGDGSGRPLLAGGPGAPSDTVAELVRSRAPLYEVVADVVVDVDGRSAAAVADAVLAAVRGHGGGRP